MALTICMSSVDVGEYRVTYKLNIMHACALNMSLNPKLKALGTGHTDSNKRVALDRKVLFTA